ncbi:hypothetical protein DSO57_1025370 [Entomophthora muscae]|uniref:Uncharacterized protein n=1 Tax=Entomophthora muscae TaxID=34485 RepID=A0ACC2UC88_9FUNG|nr:hypothetical protein DSO57_1025370 [Entomophthora muscae]
MFIFLQRHPVGADEDAYHPLNWTTKDLALGENKLGYTYSLPPGFRWVRDGSFGSAHAISNAQRQVHGTFKNQRKIQFEYEELSQSLFLDVNQAFTKTECFWLIFGCKMRILPEPIYYKSVHIEAIKNFSIINHLESSCNHLDNTTTSCIDAELAVSNPLRLIRIF